MSDDSGGRLGRSKVVYMSSTSVEQVSDRIDLLTLHVIRLQDQAEAQVTVCKMCMGISAGMFMIMLFLLVMM